MRTFITHYYTVLVYRDTALRVNPDTKGNSMKSTRCFFLLIISTHVLQSAQLSYLPESTPRAEPVPSNLLQRRLFIKKIVDSVHHEILRKNNSINDWFFYNTMQTYAKSRNVHYHTWLDERKKALESNMTSGLVWLLKQATQKKSHADIT